MALLSDGGGGAAAGRRNLINKRPGELRRRQEICAGPSGQIQKQSCAACPIEVGQRRPIKDVGPTWMGAAWPPASSNSVAICNIITDTRTGRRKSNARAPGPGRVSGDQFNLFALKRQLGALVAPAAARNRAAFARFRSRALPLIAVVKRHSSFKSRARARRAGHSRRAGPPPPTIKRDKLRHSTTTDDDDQRRRRRSQTKCFIISLLFARPR
jgi:hypothetical protein